LPQHPEVFQTTKEALEKSWKGACNTAITEFNIEIISGMIVCLIDGHVIALALRDKFFWAGLGIRVNSV
jgi:hypothetical protein